MAGRNYYWTAPVVLKRLRRAVREIYNGNISRLPSSPAQYLSDIKPFNQTDLYPSPDTVNRLCGGLKKAWEVLGYKVSEYQRRYREANKSKVSERRRRAEAA